MRVIAVFVLMMMFIGGRAQDSVSLTNKQIAAQQIEALKNGALVVCLKSNDKSIEAYRKSGKKELVNKMIAERDAQNLKIMNAFKKEFDFCKVYFIYARNSKELVSGAAGIFLNDTLGEDPSIKLTEKYFLVAEYGTVVSNERKNEYRYDGVKTTEPSVSPSTTSAIFISDTSFEQLKEPFPFYQNVYFDNYDKTVARLNKGLHSYYFSVVTKTGKKIRSGD